MVVGGRFKAHIHDWTFGGLLHYSLELKGRQDNDGMDCEWEELEPLCSQTESSMAIDILR